MTIRLFDQDVDLREFSATVLSCEAAGAAYAVILDRTAFFPEGGGQGADHGTLNGFSVTDVHDKQGVITHTVSGSLPVGTIVHGIVDGVRRLDMMQQHSGEHILSGIICAMKNCSNVGFHIGDEDVRLDFSAQLTPDELLLAEQKANDAIWQNIPIEAWVPGPEELAMIDYRSKKAIDGDLRIVRIAGCDTCACCGTHVHTTGQVGQIKIIDAINYKGGTRLSIRCGNRALRWANDTLTQTKDISHRLSAKPNEIASAVERLDAERDRLKLLAVQRAMQAFDAKAEAERSHAVRILLADMLDNGQLRKAAGNLAEGAQLALLLLPKDSGWNYALCSLETDVRPLSKLLNETFDGKGGGPKDMVQGVLNRGSYEEIRAFVLQNT